MHMSKKYLFTIFIHFYLNQFDHKVLQKFSSHSCKPRVYSTPAEKLMQEKMKYPPYYIYCSILALYSQSHPIPTNHNLAL